MSDFPKQIKVQVGFDIGETVYLITDPEQSKYMVLTYIVKPSEVLYEIYNHGYGLYTAYDFELTRTKEI